MTTTSTQHAEPWTVDADRWPDVAVAAGSPARAAVARALFTTAVAQGCRTAAPINARAVAGTPRPCTLAANECPSGRPSTTLRASRASGSGRLIRYRPSTG